MYDVCVIGHVTREVIRAAGKLSQYGIDEVIITLGDKGSLIHSKGELHRIAAFPQPCHH